MSFTFLINKKPFNLVYNNKTRYFDIIDIIKWDYIIEPIIIQPCYLIYKIKWGKKINIYKYAYIFNYIKSLYKYIT